MKEKQLFIALDADNDIASCSFVNVTSRTVRNYLHKSEHKEEVQEKSFVR